MRNVMAALSNIGGALRSMQVWLTPTATVSCTNAAKTRNPLKLAGVPQTNKPISGAMGQRSPYCQDKWGTYCYLTSIFSVCRYMP